MGYDKIYSYKKSTLIALCRPLRLVVKRRAAMSNKLPARGFRSKSCLYAEH